MTTFNLADLAAIESHLSSHPYLSGGAFPNAEDIRIFSELKGIPDKKANPALYHWYNFINLFTPNVRDAWLGKAPAAKEEKKENKPAKGAEKEKAEKPATDVKPAAEGKAKKPKPVAKSILIFDVKIFDQETDLTALSKKVFALEVDGLVWGQEVKILPVAFGINKLQLSCVIEDDKVSTDDLFEKIESWEEVQSTDIVTMQKN